jgi:AraC-like DNA-binding protein
MFVHSSRIKKQLDYLSTRGVDTAQIYALAGISEKDVNDPQQTFLHDQFLKVFSFALAATGDEYYGLKMGQEPHIAGTIGIMSASCSTLKEAFIQGCTYFQVQGNFAEILFLDDPVHPKIVYQINESWWVKDPLTARHEVDAMFSFLAAVLAMNTNYSCTPYQVSLTREPPVDQQPYKKYLGVEPLFRQAENAMFFRAADLLHPMKGQNPELFRILKAHVEEHLRKFTGTELITDKVRAILLSSAQYTFPDMESVSSKLNVSSRTLQRMLARENTNFKTILQDTRIELAKQLLSRETLTVSEIAYYLGYSDLGNFSRSFKNYTGLSPQNYRNQFEKQ